MTTVQYDILIADDNLVEEHESYEFTIFQSLLPTNVNAGEVNQVTVIVVDDDCMFIKYYINR